MKDFTLVAVIIPVFNEGNTIIKSIESLINGDYPFDKFEFIIVDGDSSDNTLAKIEDFSGKNPNIKIKILNNPLRTQGYGLNIGIENVEEESEIVVRADAHSVYPKNYIKDCVQTLLSVNADNVGGVMVPEGKTGIQKAVSFCMSHWLGVGDAKFHIGNYSGFVDTVYLGCFKKDIIKKMGLFDPVVTPNEDAEFNMRILKCGGKIYLNSNIKVKYFPRETIVKLIDQYFKYGQGRCRTFKKHRKFTSMRQIIPPLWVISTLIFIWMSFISKLFIIPLIVYLSILFLVAINGVLKNRDLNLMFSPICFAVMHYGWGLGFLSEFVRKSKSKSK